MIGKRARWILGATALAWVMADYAPAGGGDEQVFGGEIADTQCALNVHSLSQSHKVATLDPKTDVIAVRAIEPASPSAGKTPPPK